MPTCGEAFPGRNFTNEQQDHPRPSDKNPSIGW
jgi:hypothetical protein